MEAKINPFHELYIGESIGPEKFVDLFSQVIVEHAHALFQPGNVILKGLPGTGKSMLLNLLKPSIRLAYLEADQEFPVPKDLRKFVGAGINLKRSGVSDFGQRPIDDNAITGKTTPIYFGDFLNYWLVSDILNNIQKLATEDTSGKLSKEIGFKYNEKNLSDFAREVSELDCWGGFLQDCNTYSKLTKRIHWRINTYRDFLNYNIEILPDEIKSTKTIVGIPISKVAEALRAHKIIGKDSEIYIRIDQYEELAWLDDSTDEIGTTFQSIIHKLLGMRDTAVSYRIGTRHFAWTGDKFMFGTNARLEKKRNYAEVSIDSVLRRKENARTWVFPQFAEDIFTRRLKLTSYKINPGKLPLLQSVFGKTYAPEESAKLYVPNEPEKAVRTEPEWPEKWVEFLKNLSSESPLSARLAEAWSRQKGKSGVMKNIPKKPFVWETKKWWRKERVEQALLQIASRNQQQLIWYGKDDILGLSGGNILVFLSLCQHIWDVWIRDTRNDIRDDLNLPKIDHVIQSAGMREASADWFNDISNEKGGKQRKAFISFLGGYFYKTLVEDKSMSYPGNNGFSISLDEMDQYKNVYDFLKDASDYGDLYDVPHTSKLSDKKARHKWYLNPVLSPYFKIPYSHTKEPIYANIEILNNWLINSGAFNSSDLKSPILKRDRRNSKSKSGRSRSGQMKMPL